MSEQEKQMLKELKAQYEKLDENGKAIVTITANALAARQEMESQNDKEEKKS